MPLAAERMSPLLQVPLDPAARTPLIGADFAYTPLALPGLVAWFDPVSVVGIAHGAAVSSWSSLIGTGVAAQATGSKQPLYQIGVLNGRNTVLFDGVDDALVTGALIGFNNTPNLTVIGVMRGPTFTGSRAIGVSWAGGFGSSTDGAAWQYTSATAVSGFVRTAAGAGNAGSGGTITANSWHCHAFRNDGNLPGPTAFLDGALKSSSNVASGVPTTHNTVTLGASTSGSANFCSLEIAELLLCNVPIATGDMMRLYTDYFKPKFGI